MLAFPGPSIEGWCVDGVLPGYDGSLSLTELRPLLADLSDEALDAYADHVHVLHGVGRPTATPSLPDWADANEFVLVPRPASPRFEESWLSSGEQSSLEAVAPHPLPARPGEGGPKIVQRPREARGADLRPGVYGARGLQHRGRRHAPTEDIAALVQEQLTARGHRGQHQPHSHRRRQWAG